MTFPSIRSSTCSASPSLRTSHDFTLPATISAGDLLLLFGSMDSSSTITGPAGWSTVLNNGTNFLFTKTADGTEDGTSVTITTSTGKNNTINGYAVYGHKGSPVVSSVSNSMNPPSLTSGFGAVDTLWIAVAQSGVTSITAAPTNYSGLITASAYNKSGSAYRELSAASEDPGAFSGGGIAPMAAFVIAIEGALPANGLFFGSNF